MNSEPRTPAPTGGLLLAVNVGNTRTAVGLFRDWRRESFESHPNEQADAALAAVRTVAAALASEPRAAILIASVNDALADRVERAAREAIGSPERVHRLGRDVPIQVRHTLDDAGARTVGQDRLLAAIAAFDVVRQACVVIDAGTAITVNFVDGEGAFHGGAILPGVGLMLRALHEHTAALPAVKPERPILADASDERGFPANTPEAMRAGAYFAARGAVRALVERFAEIYEAYPQIIATGGDAQFLFEGDELVEHIVPDLVLRGIVAVARRWAEEGDEDDGPTPHVAPIRHDAQPRES